ncbi:MAG TPA: SUMF1/EgtB/PvdO family nonheme iron enzyme [Gemmataceae bacterium]|nr:SUMF1/EgtB/PvdO family nonheme iron enzyme [Gemmataceae bacterium]
MTLVLTAVHVECVKPAAPPTTRIGAVDALSLDDPPMRFLRISPNRYGFEADDFFMLESEVTNAMYSAFLVATGANKGDEEVVAAIARRRASHSFSTADPSYGSDNPDLRWNGNRPPAGKEEFPVGMVNARQASAFCAWLTKRHPGRGTFRLPTKTEWLIAAYGRDRKFPWGDEDDPARYLRSPFREHTSWELEKIKRELDAQVEADRTGKPVAPPAMPPIPSSEPVKSRPAGRTPEGLYGMWGNVSELVIPDERKGNRYVIGLGGKWMGGGFDDTAWEPRQDYWGYTHNSDVRQEAIGFRVVLDVSPAAGEYRHELGPNAQPGGSIYGSPDEWGRPSRWPPATSTAPAK